MAEKSVYRYRVEPEAVDFTMHATISALGAAVLNAAGVDAHGKGFGVDALTKHNCSWVLSRLALELDRPPAQYDDYRIATWISDYGRVLSTRNFVLEDAEGRTFGRAVSQWAMIDLDTRTALDLSGVGRAHDDALVAEPSPAEKPRKIRSVEPAEHLAHRVAYSDIDFNRHVNSARYVELILNQFDLPTYDDFYLSRFEIEYKHEAHFGDEVEVCSSFQDETLVTAIQLDETPVCVARSFMTPRGKEKESDTTQQ